MQWLLHGKLTAAVAEAMRRHEHVVHELTELALAEDADCADVLKAARDKQWDLLTCDGKLAMACFHLDFWFNRSIVYLQLEGGDVEFDDAIDRLFARYKHLTPGRLYTVTATRVKIRQLPSSHPSNTPEKD